MKSTTLATNIGSHGRACGMCHTTDCIIVYFAPLGIRSEMVRQRVQHSQDLLNVLAIRHVKPHFKCTGCLIFGGGLMYTDPNY